MSARGRRGARLAVAVVLALTLPGCGPGEDDGGVPPETTTEPSMTPSTAAPEPTAGPTTGRPGHATSGTDPAAVAARDLAERLGVAVEEVTVLRVTDVTWRDGALGCPQPGMAYTQALTRGQVIELGAQDRTYSYHSAPGREPFLCERPQPPLRTDT